MKKINEKLFKFYVETKNIEYIIHFLNDYLNFHI